jgi:hypothetical protein
MAKVDTAIGVDAIQALQLAMVMIGAELEALSKRIDGKLTWEGSNDDFGFPTTVTLNGSEY